MIFPRKILQLRKFYIYRMKWCMGPDIAGGDYNLTYVDFRVDTNTCTVPCTVKPRLKKNNIVTLI